MSLYSTNMAISETKKGRKMIVVWWCGGTITTMMEEKDVAINVMYLQCYTKLINAHTILFHSRTLKSATDILQRNIK